jgi:hypothetical protein
MNRPREIAYFNSPIPPRNTSGFEASNWAMASPSFVPSRREIWYSDGYTGFWAVRVSDDVWPGGGGGGGGGSTRDDDDAASPGGGGGFGGGSGGGGGAGYPAGHATVSAADRSPFHSGAPQVTAASAESRGALPFTGLALAAIAISGLVAIVAGVTLRRRVIGRKAS